MASIDSKFFDVELNSNSPSECSPDLPAGATQEIRIAGPSRSPLEAASVNVPICGTFTMPVPSPPSDEPIVFHVVNRATGDRYEGPIVQLDENPIEPPPEDDPFPAEALKGVTVTGYFAHNLLDHVNLPVEAGVYEVFVQWRDVNSNTVTVELF